jgi:bifunctional DNA-binding transcriptional regulator/antitoxin component of YhaV-PrlF toxin-antitoxin module
MNKLPREWRQLDNRGRIVIPKHFLEALGITEKMMQEKYPVLIEIHPNIEEAKYLSIKKK